MNKDSILKIYAIEMDNGYFLTDTLTDNFYQRTSMFSYTFDGKQGQKTFSPLWVRVDKLPTTVEKIINDKPVNYRYELIDKSLVSPSIPLTIPKDEMCSKDNPDEINPQYDNISALYRLVCDYEEQPNQPVDFEIEVILKVHGDINDRDLLIGEGFSGKIRATDLQYQTINKICYPEVVHHLTPVSLSPQATYAIIRNHIESNIDRRVATITSNYDFCMTVKKYVFSNTTDLDILLSGNLKNVMEQIKRNKVSGNTFLEIAPKPYRNYRVISGFRGKNLEDLKNNIRIFLTSLMREINKPEQICTNCQGMGVIGRINIYDHTPELAEILNNGR